MNLSVEHGLRCLVDRNSARLPWTYQPSGASQHIQSHGRGKQCCIAQGGVVCLGLIAGLPGCIHHNAVCRVIVLA